MRHDELEVLKEKDYAIYKQEVASAIEPKLHLLLAHLYIEHLLERYISTKLKTTNGLFGQNGLPFEKKVCLAQSFGGLNAQRIDGIRKLNDLRNDCVHKFKHQPTEKQIDDFGRTFGKWYGEIKIKYAQNQDALIRACCNRLAGAVLRVVLEAENDVSR